MTKINILLILTFLLITNYRAQGAKVVASTSWTAAFAKAAGADSVEVIAPIQLQHPPEYELKPSDLERIKGADLVVYAGYERFVEKLVETSEDEKIELLKIETNNDPVAVKFQARLIAEKLGTLSAYDTWIADFESTINTLKTNFHQSYPNKTAVVHKFQIPFAKWLGLEIVGEFGPAQPSPKLIANLIGQKADFVIDNYHNPIGSPISESTNADYVQFINFPGSFNTQSIEDVYHHNYEQLRIAKSLPAEKQANKPMILVALIVVVMIILSAAIFFLKGRQR